MVHNFWRFFDLPLFNCEIELDLSWSKNCVISEISGTVAVAANTNANPPIQARAATQTNGSIIHISNSTFYVPAVTLFINDHIKFLEKIKQGFKRKIS